MTQDTRWDKLIYELLGDFDPIGRGFGQFTLDWIERQQMGILNDEDEIDHTEYAAAMSYEVDNILEVMRPGLIDRTFFATVREWLDAVAA